MNRYSTSSYLRRPLVSIARTTNNCSQSLFWQQSRSLKKSTRLHYDPTNEDTDFTSFGILPFIQSRLNQLIPSGTIAQTSVPFQNTQTSVPLQNTQPSEDQRKLLSVLQSKYTTILNGKTTSGKSLGLAVYCLNLTLSRVPKYGSLVKRSSIDSIIMVPTDEMVSRYKHYFGELTKDIPENCCPDKLILDKETQKYTLTRKPLSIQFLYANKPSENVSSGKETTVPQILVTTITGLQKLLRDEESHEHLAYLHTFSVDNYDYFFKTSQINNESLVSQTGTKAKYTNKVESIIKSIQELHLTTFNKDLNYRLKRVTEKYKESEKETHLEKRLTKIKRQFLYKPIQFCFIANVQPLYTQLLNTKSNLSKSVSINHAIQNHSRSIPVDTELDHKVHDLYAKYLIEKSTQISEKDADPLRKYLEKIVRLNTQQERQRAIVYASSGQPETPHVNAYFPIIKGGEEGIKDLDIEQNYPSNTKRIELMDEHVELSKNNVKNLEKAYLKYKMTLGGSDHSNVRKSIAELIKSFQVKTENDQPFLIVVPPYINPTKIAKKLNKTVKHETFKTLKQESSNKHLIIHPSQLVGNDLKYSNIIVFGIDCLLPQTAFQTPKSADDINSISGIIDPFNDLSTFYLDKLVGDKHILFVTDTYTTKLTKDIRNMFEQDLKRFSQIIMYNGLLSQVKVSPLASEKEPLHYGIDPKFVSTINSKITKPKPKVQL